MQLKPRITTTLVLLLLLILLFASAFFSNVWTSSSFGSQLFAAFTGSIITSIIVMYQFKIQRESDNEKKFNENKLDAYSNFISEMWEAAARCDSGENDEIYERLRKSLFSKLPLYLTKDELCGVSAAISKVNDWTKEDDIKNLCTQLTNILRNSCSSYDAEFNGFVDIWDGFGLNPQNNNLKVEKVIVSDTSKGLVNNCFHFILHDEGWQYGLFEKGVYGLALRERSDNDARTRSLQNAKPGDIAFLFSRGGKGYVGIFKILGWKIFVIEEDGRANKILNNVGDPVTDATEIEREAMKYMITGANSDGYARVGILNVEPLRFIDNGVGYNTVYRRTISSFDSRQARIILTRFFTNTSSDNNCILQGRQFDIHCNEKEFKQLCQENNITPTPNQE